MAERKRGCSCKSCFASLAITDRHCSECGDGRFEDRCKNMEEEEGSMDGPTGEADKVYSNIRHSMSSSIGDQILHLLKCGICAEECDDPRMLPCVHNFCLKCLRIANDTKKPGQRTPCPVCEMDFIIPSIGLSGTTRNFYISQLLEMRRIANGDSDIACADKTSENKSEAKAEDPLGACDNHNEQVHAQRFCSVHPANVSDLHCLDCNKPICEKCSSGDHRIHVCSKVSGLFSTFGPVLNKQLSDTSDCLEDNLRAWNDIDQKIDLFKREINKVETEILTHAHDLKKMIDQQAQKLLDELKFVERTNLEELERKKNALGRFHSLLEGYTKYILEIQQQGPITEICRLSHERQKRSHELEDLKRISLECRGLEKRVFFIRSDMELSSEKENLIGKINEFDIGLVAKKVEVGNGLCGIARLENKIFVALKESRTILAFWEKRPFIRMEHENIEIQGLKDPRDLVASVVDTSLFVSDPGNTCLWKVRVPDKKVSKVVIDGEPHKLFVSPRNQLLITVKVHEINSTHRLPWLETKKEDRWFLEIHGLSEVCPPRRIALPRHIHEPEHAVRSSKGDIIVAYRVKESDDHSQVSNVYQISELSETGDIIRTCTLSNASLSLNKPIYLSVTGDYRVFVVDMMNNSILLLDETLTSARVLVTRDKEQQLVAPQRLHYSLDDHMMIVGCFSAFLVFDLYQTRT